jgi:tRNA threonylcarbamoyl adenosine modification protein YjeE
LNADPRGGRARSGGGRRSSRLRSSGEAATREIGRRLGSTLRPGDDVLLSGSLGSGKTVLARGIAEGVGVDPAEVRSPTFTLVNIYPGRLAVYHVDLYRIDKPGDLTELGLEDILGGDGVAIVEWPEKLGRYLPAGGVRIRILDRGEERREIIVEDRRSRE